jgi:arylsulfatase A-like enzyme
MHDPDSGDPLRPPPRRPIFQGLFSGVVASILFAASAGSSGPALAQQSARKPNILVIMGDDVGWFNIGAYHRGIMSGKTPNLDKLAAEGMMFTDYYAEASCTAGRANFITGELPLRTGLTTVGQAGAEAGMAQLDDSIGQLLQHIQDIGEADNTIVIFTTDNGAEVFTWPDGGMTPFRATKGTVFEGGFRVPCIIRWPGKVKPGSVENGIFSGLDWLPTLADAAGNPNITGQLLKGVTLEGHTYKNHLDGYDQMSVLLGKGPSVRHELFYFGGPKLGAIRIDEMKFQFYQQPWGWPGEKVTTDMPTIVNLRQDPFERTPSIRGESLNDQGGGFVNDSASSGASSSCSRKSRRWHRQPSNIPRCKHQPPSTSKRSKPRSRSS